MTRDRGNGKNYLSDFFNNLDITGGGIFDVYLMDFTCLVNRDVGNSVSSCGDNNDLNLFLP